jgi:pimeloyl-ACP methyl ester carboxylesterase
VASLCLVNPAGALVPAEEMSEFVALLHPRDAADARRYLALAFHKPPLALRLAPGEVIKAMRSAATQGFLGALEDGDFLRADELRSLRVPARVLWGRHDRFLPPATLGFFRRHLPAARVELLERAGHCPHLEVPGELARAIVAE